MESKESLQQIFGSEGLSKMKNDPVLSTLVEDPSFFEMVKDIQNNPGNILKYQSKFSNPLVLVQLLPYLSQRIPKEENSPQNTTLEKEKLQKHSIEEAEAAKTQGNQYFSKGNYQEALKLYEKAIELNPNNILYHTNKCTTLLNMKNYTGAINAALSAVETGEKNFATVDQMWKAYMKLGTAYKLANQKEKAVSAFESASLLKKDKMTHDALEQAKKM